MKNNNSGFILVQAIVGAGLVIMLAYMLSTSLSKSSAVSRQIELRGELESIRRNIINNLNCNLTTGSNGWEPYAECNMTNYTNNLKNKNGKPLFEFESDGVTIKGSSGYMIQAICENPQVGIIFSYNRQRDGKSVKDPITKQVNQWTNLFPSDGTVNFCQEYFAPKVNPTRCQQDEIMRGIGPDGEPQCESIYEAANFQVCIQFSDHSCSSQKGSIKCTECMNNLASNPDSINASDWAADANRNNPDCAHLFLKRCEEPTPDDGESETIWTPATTTLSGCAALCADNQVMVGIDSRVDTLGNQTCTIWCRENDAPIGSLGYANNMNSNNTTAPVCPSPLPQLKVIGTGDCGSKCTQTLRQARDILINYAAQLGSNDAARVDPFIRILKKNRGNSRQSARDMYNQIKSAAGYLGCDPLANTPFKIN